MWDGIPPHWMVYMSAHDVDKAKADVEANGGQVKVGPHHIPGTGRFIVCTDPSGRGVHLDAARAGDAGGGLSAASAARIPLIMDWLLHR